MKRFAGHRIRERREELGFTRVELSFDSGIPEQSIGRWERGDHEPSLTSIAHLAVVLQKPLDYFFVDDDLMSVEEIEAEYVAKKALAS